MTVHLVKLCVGVGSVEELASWIARRLDERRRRGEPAESIHVTRMTPRRPAELLAGGSLYWVVRGVIQCRQRLLDLRPVVDAEGVSRCAIILDPQLVLVEPRPRDAFQGWRYLAPADAPKDLPGSGAGGDDIPIDMRRELVALGLL